MNDNSDKLAHARSQGQARFDSITEMIQGIGFTLLALFIILGGPFTVLLWFPLVGYVTWRHASKETPKAPAYGARSKGRKTSWDPIWP